MAHKVRPQYIQKLVDGANKMLRSRKILEQYDDTLFVYVQGVLLEGGWYRGFNYFKDVEYNGAVRPALAGTFKREEGAEYVQFM